MESSDNYENGISIGKEDMDKFVDTIDCYIMGSRTYELALELSREFGWAYGDIPTIVLTHRELPVERENIEFYSGDLKKLVNDQLKPDYNNIWLVGGAGITKEFIRLNLVDDIRITIVPIILGGGTLFFDYVGHEQALHLKEVTAYKNGMVALWYGIWK